jgi:hypothetical protein
MKDTLLVNPSILSPGDRRPGPVRYKNPAAEGRKYAKVLIDPVLFRKSSELDAKRWRITRRSEQRLRLPE